MDQQLFKIVKRKIRRGNPEAELRNELRQQGIDDDEIEELFDSITKSPANRANTANESERLQLLIASCLIITGLALLSVSTNLYSIGWILLVGGVIILLPYLLKRISKSL